MKLLSLVKNTEELELLHIAENVGRNFSWLL